MAKHGCESGRHNLSFVSHSTFAKAPIGPNLADFEADFAVLGVSNDMGTQYRPGARFGPRGIREASTLVFFGHSGACDFEHDINYLPSLEVTIVDIGHVNIVHTDMEQSNANTEQRCGKLSRPVPRRSYLAGITPSTIRQWPLLRHDQYRWVRPLHRNRHWHAKPRRVFVLRRSRNLATARQKGRDCRRWSGPDSARLRPERHHLHARRTIADDFHRLYH